jgi:exosortase A-associated hydrolase 1
MPCVEEAVSFTCENDDLTGVLTRPGSGPTSDFGVIVVVGGPQYRVGSHRQFVLLARALAGAGFAVLRFDVRGMGDSSGMPRSFEAAGEDIEAAIDALRLRVPTVTQVVLVGLCDGASAALLYCHHRRSDETVKGLCLLNPWVRSEASLAVTHVKHYYTRRLVQPEFWAKLARGGVGRGAALDALRSVRIAALGARGADRSGVPNEDVPFQQRMADAWARFEGRILLVLSGDDYTAKEFVEHVGRARLGRAHWGVANSKSMTGGRRPHVFEYRSASRDGKLDRWTGLKAVVQWSSPPRHRLRARSDSVIGSKGLTAQGRCALLAGYGVALPALAQSTSTPCGSLANAFGPYDYRTDRGQPLNLVESAHFTTESGAVDSRYHRPIGVELDYTLRAFPNHHRAAGLGHALRQEDEVAAAAQPEVFGGVLHRARDSLSANDTTVRDDLCDLPVRQRSSA